jgi:hypothetical protein
MRDAETLSLLLKRCKFMLMQVARSPFACQSVCMEACVADERPSQPAQVRQTTLALVGDLCGDCSVTGVHLAFSLRVDICIDRSFHAARRVQKKTNPTVRKTPLGVTRDALVTPAHNARYAESCTATCQSHLHYWRTGFTCMH